VDNMHSHCLVDELDEGEFEVINKSLTNIDIVRITS